LKIYAAIQWCRLHWLPATKHDLQEMEKRLEKTLADLDAEIQGDLADAATQIENALTNALGKITVPEDAQPELDHIAAIAAALKAAATGLCVEGFTWSAEPAASGSAVAR
jgi:hypothetical protein